LMSCAEAVAHVVKDAAITISPRPARLWIMVSLRKGF
jgi:hypothetical protein